MFYFFHGKQDTANSRHYKGLLFEDLLRRYLGENGYVVDVSRIKQHSLEYDIRGTHGLDNRPILGEAKAHEDTVSGADVAAFVGKFLQFFYTDAAYSALFLSTSALSPEADDYLRNLSEKSPFKIASIWGASLENKIRDALRMPSHDRASAAARRLVPHQSAQHLLHTDLGTFLVVVGSSHQGNLADRFVLVAEDGTLVTNQELVLGLKRAIKAFEELDPITEKHGSTTVDPSPGSREIPSGLVTAQDWLDYRRPAGRKHFVGREDSISHSMGIFDSSDSGVVIEVKSRSGVGKSSLLATIADTCAAEGMRVELHDARDVHSSNDVFSLITRFARSTAPVQKFEDVPRALAQLASSTRAVFMVDQFESTFGSPEVFYAYEYLALCVVRTAGKIALLFARKDDLLTTHDDIQVNLDRLRETSHPVNLEDFSRQEASRLIDQIAKASNARMSPRILEQALEFAQGFPWLIKRTMAHVSAMIARGTKQQELLAGDLHLKDLFEEELSELDEHERGYLTRLASVLPATYQSLARRFENDALLPKMLEKLTGRRLLRLSAGTYDAYNDVFKDFLLYERLPDRKQSQIFRMGLGPVMRAFRAIGGKDHIDVDELGRAVGKSTGGAYNTLRELTAAGLVIKSAAGWVVPEVIREYEHQGRLGEFVRQSVLRNRAVSEFLVELEREGRFARRALAEFLQNQFPFVVAKPHIWEQYANQFVDWLQRLKLVQLSEGGSALVLALGDKDAVIRRLGNLNITTRGARQKDAPFVPAREWSVYEELLVRARKSAVAVSSLRRSGLIVCNDLVRLGVISLADDHASAMMNLAGFEAQMKKRLSGRVYQKFWTAIVNGLLWEDAIGRIPGLDKLSANTRRNLGKKLTNWGRHLGFVAKGRVNRVKSPALNVEHGGTRARKKVKEHPRSKAVIPGVAVRRSKRVAAGLNDKERVILAFLSVASGPQHLGDLAIRCFPGIDADQANSWTRNSLRKPITNGLVVKASKGAYQLTQAGRKALGTK